MIAFRSISIRLISILVVTAMLIATGMGGFHYLFSRNANIRATASEMLSTAREKRDAIQFWIRDSHKELDAIAELASNRGMFMPLLWRRQGGSPIAARIRFRQLIGPWVGERGNFDSILLLDAQDGWVAFSTRESELDSYREDRPYFREGRHAVVNHGPFYSLTLGGAAITISVPIRERDGRTIAVLVGRLNLDELGETIRRTGRQSGSFDAYLVNKNNLYVTQPRMIAEPVVLGRSITSIGIERCLAGRDGANLERDGRGVEVIAAHLWLSTTETCLTTQLDRDEALAPLGRLAQSSVSFALAVLLLSITIGVLFARRLTNPIIELARVADQIKQGEIPQLPPHQGMNEIHILWSAFDDMSRTLRLNAEQIARHTQDLESRVERRTRELEQAKALAESYLDMAGALIIALDEDGIVTMINRLGCQTLGLPESNIRGRCWFNVSQPPRKAAAILVEYLDVIHGDTPPVTQRSGWIMDAQFQRHLIDWSITWLRDDMGKITGAICAGMDVTEQNRANQALKMSEQRLMISQQMANIATWDWDRESGVLFWSDTFGQLLGIAQRPAIFSYEDFLARVYETDRERVRQVLERAIVQGGEWSVEHRVALDDGTVRWLRETGEVVDDEARQRRRMLGIVQDITVQRREDETLRHAQKLEALGNLAGGVAHSLNNLLVPVISLSEVVIDELPDDTLERKSLEKVLEAALSARDLVSRILAFSRRENVDLKVQNIVSLVERTLTLARSSMPSTIALGVNLPTEPCWVVVDGPQLEAVLFNVINNAQFVLRDRTDGKIQVALQAVNLSKEQVEAGLHLTEGRHARITISDNGPGMSEDVRSRVFDPFFTTKSVGDGTGLGLSMAHGIMRDHGGDIEVRTQVDKGTSFSLYLPLAANDQDGEPL